MKHPFKIYTRCADGLHLIAEGDHRAVELFREVCQNIHVEDTQEHPSDAPESLARVQAGLDHVRALADHCGAF